MADTIAKCGGCGGARGVNAYTVAGARKRLCRTCLLKALAAAVGR